MKKSIAFGGISRVPGGATSGDGDLSIAVNVANDGQGLQLLEKPKNLFPLDLGEELLCIHTPEGRGKHYITQIVVPTSPVTLNAGVRRVGFADHTEDLVVNGDILDGGGGGYSGGGGSGGYVTPSVEPSQDEEWQSDAYDDIIEEENATRNNDDGGADADTESVGHVYLRWRVDNGDGTSTIKQSIDITNFGKITAIQAMGNTLVCNHEGSEYYLPEVRYYLWREDSDIIDNEEVDISKYVGLGSKPPMLNITFGLESEFKYWPEAKTTDSTNYAKKYKGTHITCYPYTDTVSVWWNSTLSQSYVPPFSEYGDSIPEHWQETYSIEDVVSPDGKTDVAGIKINWTTATLGCYNRFIAEQNNRNKFVFPFYVRYAYELYDGSLIMHSYPVLMIPNSRGPVFALDGKYGLKADLDDPGETYEKVRLEFRGRTYGFSSTLMHEIAAMAEADLKRLKNWKDLIRGVNIYATPPIYNYKQGGQVLGWHCMDANAPINDGEDPWKKNYTVGKVKYGVSSTKEGYVTLDKGFTDMLGTDAAQIFLPWDNNHSVPDYCLTIPQKEEKEIYELHENAGQFFKLVSIEFETLIKRLDSIALNPEGELPLEIGNKVVNTIANQEVMTDDNGSHDTVSADVLYGYNHRLNMANVSKIMHAPLQPKVQWAREYYKVLDATENNQWQINIYAKNGGRMALMKTTADDVNVRWPLYIFYPNPNATEAVLYHGETRYKVRLREHKALNGAFWLGDFYNKYDNLRDYKLNDLLGSHLSEKHLNRTVDESSKIYTSATDNPFYVPFGNINIAGGGDVRALCAATQAMSQGQFGQHPMYCFTSEGVWAMTVNDTGGWGTIQPMTRDVIGAGSLPLSLDSTVVFLSERGLLQLAGASVEILSDALSTTDTVFDMSKFTILTSAIDTKFGLDVAPTTPTYTAMRTKAVYYTNKHFPMGDANLGYDSDNQRIYVSPLGQEFSWVYNIRSKLWTQSTTHIDKQIPTYPELVTQQGSAVVLVSVDGGLPGNRYPDGLVLTRPIKFQDMGALKKWREFILRGQFKNYTLGTPMVMSAIWGTRDWNKFALVASSQGSRITRRSGSPYFGHLVLVALHGNTTYNIQVNGFDVDVDEERVNKLR